MRCVFSGPVLSFCVDSRRGRGWYWRDVDRQRAARARNRLEVDRRASDARWRASARGKAVQSAADRRAVIRARRSRMARKAEQIEQLEALVSSWTNPVEEVAA